MARKAMFEKNLCICSLSIREEHKQLLLILGRGNMSYGFRELMDRVGSEEIQALRRRFDELKQKDEDIKTLCEEGLGVQYVEKAKALSEERRRVLRKKIRKSSARG